MSETLRLGLPLVAAAQAQKHVTVNEALTAIDTLIALRVLDRDLAEPPAETQDGDAYVVAAAATGEWQGQDGRVAHRLDDGWRFITPMAGLTAFVADEALLVVNDGAQWLTISGGGGAADLSELQEVELFGLGTTADASNPFSAYLNNALWVARTTGDGGSGDLRYVLSKEGNANVLSLLFQSDFEARAEFGLIGDDDLLFKVTDDGENWNEAIHIDNGTGEVSFPANDVSSIVKLTQAAYDALDPADEQTLYIIVAA